MQNSYTTDAINLKSYNLSDSDKIIIMYTKDKGIVKVVAKGVKKPKSKLGARMDLLVANTVQLHKGKTLNTISQAECLNTFKKTRTDLDKIYYSMYIAEIVNNFGLEDDPSAKEVYTLLYDALDAIAMSETKVDILLNVIKFQVKMMEESGFSIELEKCLHCNKNIFDKDIYFVSELGGIICKDCFSSVPYSKKLMPLKIRDFLKQMALNSFNEKGYYELKANEKVCSVVFELLRTYVERKCPKKFKSSDILNEIVL